MSPSYYDVMPGMIKEMWHVDCHALPSASCALQFFNHMTPKPDATLLAHAHAIDVMKAQDLIAFKCSILGNGFISWYRDPACCKEF